MFRLETSISIGSVFAFFIVLKKMGVILSSRYKLSSRLFGICGILSFINYRTELVADLREEFVFITLSTYVSGKFFCCRVSICLIGLIILGWFGLIFLRAFFSIVSACSGIFGRDYVFGVGERLSVLVSLVILKIVTVSFLVSVGRFRNYSVFV